MSRVIAVLPRARRHDPAPLLSQWHSVSTVGDPAIQVWRAVDLDWCCRVE
jgi:hypothetical protein